MSDLPAPVPAARPPSPWRLWQNPLLRRYCRARLRRKPLGVSLILTLVISTFIYLIAPLLAKQTDRFLIPQLNNQMERAKAAVLQNVDRGANLKEINRLLAVIEHARKRQNDEVHYQRTPLFPLLVVQALLLFLSGTGQVASGMTTEADEGMIDYQRLTPVTPLTKTLGYLFGLPVREYVLVLSTLPLTALCLWRGEVPFSAWGPVYGVFFSSVLLYHATGLVAGTVVRNKRWAFLLSMGLVFLLYTVVPQGARFGFPFVRYLTLWPVLVEHAEAMAPRFAEGLQATTGLVNGAGVPFFRLTVSDLAFTLLVQGSFVLTLLIMVWRKWKRAESHLLSKIWALLVVAWVQVLITGNALPMAETGVLFPSQNLQDSAGIVQLMDLGRRGGREIPRVDPRPVEAVAIVYVFALNLLLVLLLMVIMTTPSADAQVRGLRRARRLGRARARPWTDEASALPVVVTLLIAAGVALYGFQAAIYGSHWFTRDFPVSAPLTGTFRLLLVIALAVLLFHAALEARGGKRPFLASVFAGFVPLMAALVLMAASGASYRQHRKEASRAGTAVEWGAGRDGKLEAAFWVAGLSPFTQVAQATLPALPEGSQLGEPWRSRVSRSSLLWAIAVAGLLGWSWLDLRRQWTARRSSTGAAAQ